MPASTTPPCDVASTAEPSADERVRRRLRELRTERGLTVTDVAARAGMAVSTLSRLETGRRRLALDHLPALARALGVTVDDLLAAPERPDPRVRAQPLSRNGMTFWPLTREQPSGTSLRAFKVRFPAGRREPEVHPGHEGHEWLYVLSGRVRLVLGDQDLVLGPGEAAEFSTWTPHWTGVVDGPAEALAIFGPQGEQVHVRGAA